MRSRAWFTSTENYITNRCFSFDCFELICLSALSRRFKNSSGDFCFSAAIFAAYLSKYGFFCFSSLSASSARNFAVILKFLLHRTLGTRMARKVFNVCRIKNAIGINRFQSRKYVATRKHRNAVKFMTFFSRLNNHIRVQHASYYIWHSDTNVDVFDLMPHYLRYNENYVLRTTCETSSCVTEWNTHKWKQS